MAMDYAQPVPRAASLLERLVGAGIGEDRARQRITSGGVRVGEEIVTDPEASVPWPTAYVLVGS